MSDEVSCIDILQEQEELVQEAASLFAFKTDKCSIGTLKRQRIYACLTCSEKTPIGICYSCHISCHTTHHIIPLELKRNFSCDCGANGSCNFSREIVSRSSNSYNQNFTGKFCICESIYDDDEESVMFQCLLCEDWFHDHCLSQTPPIESDEYICSGCITQNSFLLGYSGNPNFVFSSNPLLVVKTSACPLVNSHDFLYDSKSRIDAFLLNNWKSALCQCLDCIKLLQDSNLNYLLEKEEIWEPELDPSALVNPFDLGIQELSRLDRSMTLEGIHAFDKLKESLYENLLIPCMQRQETVTQEQIKDWFQEYLEKMKCINS